MQAMESNRGGELGDGVAFELEGKDQEDFLSEEELSGLVSNLKMDEGQDIAEKKIVCDINPVVLGKIMEDVFDIKKIESEQEPVSKDEQQMIDGVLARLKRKRMDQRTGVAERKIFTIGGSSDDKDKKQGHNNRGNDDIILPEEIRTVADEARRGDINSTESSPATLKDALLRLYRARKKVKQLSLDLEGALTKDSKFLFKDQLSMARKAETEAEKNLLKKQKDIDSQAKK